jgi:hypothetical protein
MEAADRMKHSMKVKPSERCKVEGPVQPSEQELIADEHNNRQIDERRVRNQAQAFWA